LPDDLHERFIILFAENATIAAIARVALEPQRFEHHGNPESTSDPFEEGELMAFLGHSAAFFNSFKHK
jgi:hypothetical protein